MQTILNYMRGRGEQLDIEIAAATHIPLEDLQLQLSELSKRGDIIACHSTRYVKGQKIEGILCRIAGYTPAATPGRKPKARAAQ